MTASGVAARMIGWLVVGVCVSACTQDANVQHRKGYVQATTAPSGDIVITLTAPQEHPLFVVNCNGQFVWALLHVDRQADARDYRRSAWGAEVALCLSPPIRVEPGTARRFVVQRPRDERSPAPGKYRVFFPNVASDWTHPNPMAGVMRLKATQVPQERLVSNVIHLD